MKENKTVQRINWGTIGVITYTVMLLVTTMIISASGDYVIWFAAISLPLLLPLTLGTKKQKIMASVFFILSLYLICNDNEAGKKRFRGHVIMVKKRMHQLEDELKAIKENYINHNKPPTNH
jgi:hypothetical protein